MDERQLIKSALEARQRAYAPYSKYKVGAALLTHEGEIFKGCNIECAAYSVCTCAERTALLQAVFSGNRKFTAIAVVGGAEDENPESLKEFAPPCGVCRQYLREFCSPSEFKVILAKSVDDYKMFTLAELLPVDFGPEHLN